MKARRMLSTLFRKQRSLLWLALPGLLFIFVFSYLPMLGLLIAFKDYKFSDGILGSAWTGLRNFKFLFSTSDAWHITYNTLFMNALFIVFGTIASVGLAIMMNELKNKLLHSFVQSALFLPYLLSWVMSATSSSPCLARKGR